MVRDVNQNWEFLGQSLEEICRVELKNDLSSSLDPDYRPQTCDPTERVVLVF